MQIIKLMSLTIYHTFLFISTRQMLLLWLLSSSSVNLFALLQTFLIHDKIYGIKTNSLLFTYIKKILRKHMNQMLCHEKESSNKMSNKLKVWIECQIKQSDFIGKT